MTGRTRAALAKGSEQVMQWGPGLPMLRQPPDCSREASEGWAAGRSRSVSSLYYLQESLSVADEPIQGVMGLV